MLYHRHSCQWHWPGLWPWQALLLLIFRAQPECLCSDSVWVSGSVHNSGQGARSFVQNRMPVTNAKQGGRGFSETADYNPFKKLMTAGTMVMNACYLRLLDLLSIHYRATGNQNTLSRLTENWTSSQDVTEHWAQLLIECRELYPWLQRQERLQDLPAVQLQVRHYPHCSDCWLKLLTQTDTPCIAPDPGHTAKNDSSMYLPIVNCSFAVSFTK